MYTKEQGRGYTANALSFTIDDGWAIFKTNENSLIAKGLVGVFDTETQSNFFLNSHLALEVHEALIRSTESFEEDNIGADGCYLMAAIMKNTFCEWDDDRPILKVLKQELGDNHPVWNHIQVIPEQG